MKDLSSLQADCCCKTLGRFFHFDQKAVLLNNRNVASSLVRSSSGRQHVPLLQRSPYPLREAHVAPVPVPPGMQGWLAPKERGNRGRGNDQQTRGATYNARPRCHGEGPARVLGPHLRADSLVYSWLLIRSHRLCPNSITGFLVPLLQFGSPLLWKRPAGYVRRDVGLCTCPGCLVAHILVVVSPCQICY